MPNIKDKLKTYQLETNLDTIKDKREAEWKKEVKEACERRNKEIMIEECRKKERNGTVIKTKTKTIFDKLQCNEYKRQLIQGITKLNKVKAKAIIMARYGMLECKNNYKMKYGTNMCSECDKIDDENHVMNECKKYAYINREQKDTKFTYTDVYTNDPHKLDVVADEILSIWNIANGLNTVKSREI